MSGINTAEVVMPESMTPIDATSNSATTEISVSQDSMTEDVDGSIITANTIVSVENTTPAENQGINAPIEVAQTLKVVDVANIETMNVGITKRELSPDEREFYGEYGHKSIAEILLTGIDARDSSIDILSKNGPSTWIGEGYDNGNFDTEEEAFVWAKEKGYLPANATIEDMNIFGNKLGVNYMLGDELYNLEDILGVENFAFKEISTRIDLKTEMKARYGIELSEEQLSSVSLLLKHYAIRWGSLDVDEITVQNAPTTTTSTVATTTTMIVPEQTTTTTQKLPVETTTTTSVQNWGLIPPISLVRHPDQSTTTTTTVANPEVPRLASTGGSEALPLSAVGFTAVALGAAVLATKWRIAQSS